MSNELARACKAAGITRLTLRDVRRMGAASAAPAWGSHYPKPGSAASPRRLASSLTVAAMRRHLGEGAELPKPLGGTVLALCVRDHRPDVGQDAETWVEGIDVEASSSAPADVAARAGRYAKAVDLAEDPMTTVRSLTVLRLALCWMHDDALSPAEREIFAVLLADGMPTQKAINAARLLA